MDWRLERLRPTVLGASVYTIGLICICTLFFHFTRRAFLSFFVFGFGFGISRSVFDFGFTHIIGLGVGLAMDDGPRICLHIVSERNGSHRIASPRIVCRPI